VQVDSEVTAVTCKAPLFISVTEKASYCNMTKAKGRDAKPEKRPVLSTREHTYDATEAKEVAL
jgi:hypothetical protein